MASIKKVASHLDTAERQIEALRTSVSNADLVPVLTSLHSALLELSGIVRSDRV